MFYEVKELCVWSNYVLNMQETENHSDSENKDEIYCQKSNTQSETDWGIWNVK